MPLSTLAGGRNPFDVRPFPQQPDLLSPGMFARGSAHFPPLEASAMGSGTAFPPLGGQQNSSASPSKVGMFAGKAVGPATGTPRNADLIDRGIDPQPGPNAPFAVSMGRVGIPEQSLSFDAPEPSKARHKGLFPGKDGKTWLNIGAAAINGYLAGMGNPAGLANLEDMHRQRREMAEATARQQAAEQEAQRKLYEPRTVGSNLIQLQPDGTYAALYNAPEPFEDYASSLGYQPGTDDYAEAVRNYRLGSWSDDAVEAKQGLTGYRYDRMGHLQDRRYDRMGELQGDRLEVTRRGQDIASRDRRRGQDVTSRGQNIRSGDTRRGQDMTDARTRASATFRGRGGRGTPRGAATGSSARAVNPQTGQAIVFKGGVWVDEKSGKPVS